jgi:hypothetical protein
MSAGRPASTARPVLFALDHLFIPSHEDPVAQDAYDALGALDAACPEAIATLSTDDLATLVRAALAWTRPLGSGAPSHDQVTGAAARISHVLERYPAQAFSRQAA